MRALTPHFLPAATVGADGSPTQMDEVPEGTW